MAKPDLIAELNELSGKLGRPLDTEGTVPVLEARIAQAKEELTLLNSDEETSVEDEEVDTTFTEHHHSDEPITGTFGAQNEPKINEPAVNKRRIRLRVTLDVYHYKKGVDKRQPNQTKRIRQIVPAKTEIVVDGDEAVYLISQNYADAL